MWKFPPRQKPLPFTEEQIRAKAYEIWQQRGGKGGSAEEDWQRAIAELESAAAQPKHRKQALEAFGSRDDREFALKVKQFHWERLKTLISALGLAATIFAGVGLYLTYKTGQEQQQLKDHWTIMEVLTAFIRNRSPLKETSGDKKLQTAAVASDVQSALTVIGRRDAKNDPENGNLNLGETNLAQADLEGANLQETSFSEANLQGASLSEANLKEAFLLKANLREAVFFNSNLKEAFLLRANLQGAFLDKANLQGASLDEANLQKVTLAEADLQGASLDKANLQGAVLLAPDLRQTEWLTQQQLEGTNPPLLCNVALPKNIEVNPDRDCDRIPQELVKLYPSLFPNLEGAKRYVKEARKRKWE